MVELPHILRSPLPVSISAAKQEFNAKLNKLWMKVWDNSPRKIRFSQVNSEFPFTNFRKKLFKLTRKQSSIIMQIRTGHIPLNFYLKRIGKTDLDKCNNYFIDQNHIQVPEIITHFLFDCQTHKEAQKDLAAKTGRSHLSISKIVKNTDHIKALVTFINWTERFKEINR